MTAIEFHILTADQQQRWTAAVCKLCDDLANAGGRAYIVGDAVQVDTLDIALWTTRQGSFLSHERFEGPLEAPLPSILLGTIEPPASHQQLLINLDREVPPFFSRFERLIEFVDGSEPSLVASRLRYRFYRERGYPLRVNK
jgi:DNA polymerase-3 subunit chi